VNWFLNNLTNDGLVAFRRAGGGEGLFLVPDLANAIPTATDGGRTYTFQVRPGIHYSNGRLVRPADFRRPIERCLTSSPGNIYFTGIVGAAACLAKPTRCDLSRGITTGPNTVTFHLTHPDPEFLYKLALPTAEAEPADTPLKPHFPLPATGPYMFVRFVSYHGNVAEIRLARNARFEQRSAAARPDDFPAASNFVSPILTCASFTPGTQANTNAAEFCDPTIDREVQRALALEVDQPQAAAKQWAKVDHDVTDQAPWLSYSNDRIVEFVSSRLGNYVYSAMNSGALLDQLWVR
jgi:ABC-type transport system substrate-binding protein